MKIVINADFGGFGYGVHPDYKDMVYRRRTNRTDPALIQFVENNPLKCGDLKVVTIPDCATDWNVNEYDGNETIIYVVDGKLHYIS